MKKFHVYAEGSYTFTKVIEAETEEEAQEKFSMESAEVCWQCGNDGIEIHDFSDNYTVEEVEEE